MDIRSIFLLQQLDFCRSPCVNISVLFISTIPPFSVFIMNHYQILNTIMCHISFQCNIFATKVLRNKISIDIFDFLCGWNTFFVGRFFYYFRFGRCFFGWCCFFAGRGCIFNCIRRRFNYRLQNSFDVGLGFIFSLNRIVHTARGCKRKFCKKCVKGVNLICLDSVFGCIVKEEFAIVYISKCAVAFFR